MKVKEIHTRYFAKRNGIRLKMTAYADQETLEEILREVAQVLQKKGHRAKKHGGRVEYRIQIKEK